jgi:hypothetical protein
VFPHAAHAVSARSRLAAIPLHLQHLNERERNDAREFTQLLDTFPRIVQEYCDDLWMLPGSPWVILKQESSHFLELSNGTPSCQFVK